MGFEKLALHMIASVAKFVICLSLVFRGFFAEGAPTVPHTVGPPMGRLPQPPAATLVARAAFDGSEYGPDYLVLLPGEQVAPVAYESQATTAATRQAAVTATTASNNSQQPQQ